jgi:hypothetical protein
VQCVVASVQTSAQYCFADAGLYPACGLWHAVCCGIWHLVVKDVNLKIWGESA